MNSNLFKSLRYNTMLLESLGWDDNQLKALFDYIDDAFNRDVPEHPHVIVKIIDENFGSATANCFTSILKEVMLEYNLYFLEE